MAIRLLVAIAFSMAGSVCFGNDDCTTATELQPRLCPVKLPGISTVRIEENGAKSPAADDKATDCSGFRVTAKGVRRFLRRAWEANESDAHHTLDWSPCYASGTLTFEDGRTAHWSISQFRTGSLSIEGEKRVFLYCPRCKYQPFLW
jgi:hypothetical protein